MCLLQATGEVVPGSQPPPCGAVQGALLPPLLPNAPGPLRQPHQGTSTLCCSTPYLPRYPLPTTVPPTNHGTLLPTTVPPTYHGTSLLDHGTSLLIILRTYCTTVPTLRSTAPGILLSHTVTHDITGNYHGVWRPTMMHGSPSRGSGNLSWCIPSQWYYHPTTMFTDSSWDMATIIARGNPSSYSTVCNTVDCRVTWQHEATW